jgi:predicted metalloprotease with PDZ domain
MTTRARILATLALSLLLWPGSLHATLATAAAETPPVSDAANTPALRGALTLAVDASRAAQKIYHVEETMPAAPGPFTFVYPKWIPGYHGPVGPIEDVVSLRVSANGTTLDWRRDLVDFYAVHTTVPPGATSVQVDFDLVGAPSQNGQTEAVSTPQLALLEFSNLVVYPQGASAQNTEVRAQLTLPAGWTFGTALPVLSQAGATIEFAPASLYTLVDSPLLAGAHEKAFPLGEREELDAASDSAAGLEITPKFLLGLKHLVAEAPALYGGKHYRDYHFLLTLSDAVGVEGIEHHESSDNRAGEDYASDDSKYRFLADLLPHEYSHSWNGKYRRPADLSPPDYQAPEETDLLWVYEGLNQYNGEKLATRARLNTFQDELDALAYTAAAQDFESGRAWRSVRDTADGAPFLYPAPHEFYELRRSGDDFYDEGDLIWLDADVTIRRLTHGARSLDDFCKLWGDGSDTRSVPVVHTYTVDDVYRLLGRVAPYDWAGFFKRRIATIAPRADTAGITQGGYRLVYSDKPSELEKSRDDQDKIFDARFSLGFEISTEDAQQGTLRNVLTDGQAFSAGLGDGMRIVAVDGRAFSEDVLEDALRAHLGRTDPLELIVANGDFFKVIRLDASGGLRFPHLERVAGSPDELERIYAPRTFSARDAS